MFLKSWIQSLTNRMVFNRSRRRYGLSARTRYLGKRPAALNTILVGAPAERLEDRMLLSNSTISVAVSADVTENSGTALTYTFTRTGGDASGAIDVGYTLSGTAVAADFTNGSPSPFTIPDGVGTASFTITPIGDSTVETDETVILTIDTVTGTGNTVGAPNVATGTILNDDPTVSIAATTQAAEAGSVSGQFTVTLNSASVGTTTVTYTVGGSATAGGIDYTTLSGTVDIAAGATTAVIDVTGIVNDTFIEGNETVVVTLATANNGAFVATTPNNTATVGIVDNDTTTVSIVATDPTASETPVDNGRFTVALGAPATAPVVVNYTVSGTATNGTDYTLLSGSVTILTGASTAFIDVTGIVDDGLIEGAETVIVTLTSTDNASVSVGAPASAIVSITDNEATTVSIVATDPTASETPTNNGLFTVTTALAVANDVVVNYSVTGSATPTGDYTTLSGSVTILAGTTTATINVNGIIDDTLFEGDETVIVSLTSTNNASVTVGAPASATVTITDNDAMPTVTLGVSPTSMSETGGSATVTATLSAVSGQDVIVDLAFSGTATNLSDYTRTGVQIVILAGSTSGTVTLAALPDLLNESNETIVIDIAAVTNGTEMGTQQVTETILDDDAAPTVTLAIAPASIAEAAGTATVTATLSAVSGQNVIVDLAFSGTATNVSDYVRSGAQIVILAGSTSGTVTLLAVQDTLDETNETIVVDISAVTNGTELGTQQDSVTITDDDATPSVTLGVSPATLAEAAGTTTVTATLSAVSGQDVIVDLAFSGTATNVSDYVRSGTQIVILAGSTSGSVTLLAVQDLLDETDETVVVDISAVTNGTESGTQQVIATIIDDDATPTVTLAIAPASIAEAAGTATVTATLSAVSGQNVTVDLAFSGTATNISDYVRSGVQIVILAGSTSGSVTVTAVQDLLDEIDETIVVDISAVTNGTELGTQQDTVTITDDDATPTVTLAIAPASIAEAAGTATVTATLSAVSGQNVIVDLAFSGTATNVSDYIRSGAQIVILAGSTSGTVTLTAVQDLLDESNETIVVDISGVTNGTELGTQQDTVTITDDDATPTVTLAIVPSSIAETGGSATVTATLSAVSGQDVIVDLAFSGSATNLSDYLSSGAQIVILAGSTSGTVTLTTLSDLLDESNETIVVDISAVTNGTESGTQQDTVTIVDDDATPTVTLAIAPSSMAETGGTATVTATLSAVSGQNVTVDLAFSGTATNLSDYTRSGVQIVILAGSTSGTVTLTAVPDLLNETNETIVVDISGVTNGTELGTQQDTVTITDDDAAPTVTLAIAPTSISETGGSATVTATLSAVSTQNVIVDLAFSGTATNLSDYTRSGAQIVIAAGSLTGTVTLIAVTDLRDEPNETVIVDISAVTNGTESGTQQDTLTITDDDATPTVTLAIAPSSIAEAAGIATVTATLSAVSGQNVVVDLAFSGTAINLSDYVGTGTQIVILAGNTSGSISLIAAQDTLDESNETIVVDISAVTNATELGTQQDTVTIIDDDATPTVTLAIAPSSMAETGGSATVTATLSAVSGQNVTVDLAFSGTATNLSDYTRSGAQIVILAGSTSGTVTLTALPDLLSLGALSRPLMGGSKPAR